MYVLLVEARLAGLPAEAPDHRLALGIIPDTIGAATNTVTIAVLGIGIGQDRCFGNGFQ
ncbi:hypothetical protein D3C77_502900 [compost metagenome]